MAEFQRVDALSNAHVGAAFEEVALKLFIGTIPDLRRGFSITIGVYAQKEHSFDLGSATAKTIIECKSHTWTAGGNVPSAKLTTWDQAMLYFFLAPRSYRKIMFVKRDFSPKKGESLCSYYLRTHPHLIPDEVEFWEADEDTGEAARVEFDLTARHD